MNTPRRFGFFDWLRRGAVPIDGFARTDDNAFEFEDGATVDQEREVIAPRVEPLPYEPVRWGNFR